MRLLHTADWHLGRLFHQVHLTEDQAHVLRQVIEIARDAKVNAVVIAGDVFDRAVPPPEAVRLLDDTLAELVLNLRIPTILISGNHDSPERLAFGARLMAAQGLHVVGASSGTRTPVVVEDSDGQVLFYAVPYTEPAVVREQLGKPEIVDHQTAVQELLASLQQAGPRKQRSVVVAHAFVQGALVSDSERPLSVGGTGAVEARTFDGFSYVALGHLHRPQAVGADSVQYSGAILKYSFNEVDQERSVSIVEMDAGGACRVERVRLSPRRELRRIEGTLEQILHTPHEPRDREDYCLVTLLDRHPVLDPMGKLRKVYPNVLSVERAQPAGLPVAAGAGDRSQQDVLELFEGFFREVTGNPPIPKERDVFAAVAEVVQRGEREVRG